MKNNNINIEFGDKYFFTTLEHENGKKEVITNSLIEENNDINIERSITIRKNLKVTGNLELGKEKHIISDTNGYLLHSKISAESASNGEILGFNCGKCYTTYPTDFIFLKPNFPKSIIYNDIEYSVEEFENKTMTKCWQFVLPNTIINNIIYVQFYFLNIFEKMNSMEFQYQFNVLNNNKINLLELHNNIKERLSTNIFTTNLIQTYIKTDDDGGIKGKVCNLYIKRNKDLNSIDSFEHSIYLIGVKIEYNINYFNRIN